MIVPVCAKVKKLARDHSFDLAESRATEAVDLSQFGRAPWTPKLEDRLSAPSDDVNVGGTVIV